MNQSERHKRATFCTATVKKLKCKQTEVAGALSSGCLGKKSVGISDGGDGRSSMANGK